MSFREISDKLKFTYNSANDDIVNEFYNPVLSQAVKYDRISGFFSSTSLAIAARGIVNFIRNHGHMRILCGAKLSEDDLNSIQNSDDLKNIIDLRVPSEIKKEGGDRISLMSVKPAVINLPMKSYRGFERLSYESYMEDNPQALRGFFNTVADASKLPVLFHCSAGKDRTGIMAALLLDILGASREDIFDDYLQSQRNSPHLKVNRTWLEAAFKIADEAGGTEKFLISCGVNPETLKKIKKNLVR